MNLRRACSKALQSEGIPEASGIEAHINGLWQPGHQCLAPSILPFCRTSWVWGGHTIPILQVNEQVSAASPASK